MLITILIAWLLWNGYCFALTEQWRRELAAAQQRKQVQP